MSVKMFVSYSSENLRFVEKIELLISRKFRNKIEPVLSVHHKEIGADIPDKIIGYIEECGWFLVLLTRQSISNPTVIHELGYANALFKAGIIGRIIPIVERVKDNSGKWVTIDTGVFFNRNVESAKYIEGEDKWDECINDIAEYLTNAYETERQPNDEVHADRAKRLSDHGYNWESAERYKQAAADLGRKGEIYKGIEIYRQAIEQYKISEYYWEAASQYANIAKILEKSHKLHDAAIEYLNRGDVLINRVEDYAWETGKSYEKAGKLFKKVGDLMNAKLSIQKAIKIFEENKDYPESEKLKKLLEDWGIDKETIISRD